MRAQWLIAGIVFGLGCGRKPAPGPTPKVSTTPPASSGAETPRSRPQVPAEVSRPPSPPGGTPAETSQDPPAEAAQGPVLLLLANGAITLQLFPGWPLVIRAEVAAPDERAWKLSGGTNPVSGLVRLELPGAGSWPLQPAFQAPSTLQVGPEPGTLMVWRLSPEDTAALGPGEVRVRATLSGTGMEDSWKGSVSSQEVLIKIAPEPKPLSPSLAGKKEEIFAEYVFWTEGAEKAIARVRDSYKKFPNNWRLSVLEGHFQASHKDFQASVACYDRALLEWHRQNPRAIDPPMDLLVQRDLILALLRASGKPARK